MISKRKLFTCLGILEILTLYLEKDYKKKKNLYFLRFLITFIGFKLCHGNKYNITNIYHSYFAAVSRIPYKSEIYIINCLLRLYLLHRSWEKNKCCLIAYYEETDTRNVGIIERYSEWKLYRDLLKVVLFFIFFIFLNISLHNGYHKKTLFLVLFVFINAEISFKID